MMRWVIPVLLLWVGFASADSVSVLSQDLQSVKVYREGMMNVIAFAASRRDLFPEAKQKDSILLTREERETVWGLWKPFLDYMIALDSMRETHDRFLTKTGEERDISFLAYYSSFLAQYRFALEFVLMADKNPGMETILNESVPEVGLDRNTYAKIKQRFLLNPVKGGGWGALETLYRAMNIREWPEIRAMIKQDSEFIKDLAKGRYELMAMMGAADMSKKITMDTLFPVQSGVSEWMGDTKVYRPARALISQEQIQTMAPKLVPGDILLERREWYLSNIGLPGYWPHAALYIGTPEERAKFFDGPEVKQWVQSKGQADGSVESYLKSLYPIAYRKSTRLYMGHHPRVLEAMSEGVSFTSLEHSAEADSVSVLRPRLSKKEKAIAIVRAFRYAGRPYDFNFDFQTDSSLVCTELIYKAYEPGKEFKGLQFPLVDIIGRKATPANEMVRQFDAQYDTEAQQTDFVLFLDGFEKEKRAVESSLPAFRSSWKRPKWHILAQKAD